MGEEGTPRGEGTPPEPPTFKTLITLLPVTFSKLDPQVGMLVVFDFGFLSCKKKKKKKKKKSALNRTFSTESYRNWRKSINILKNNGLFLKNKQ